MSKETSIIVLGLWVLVIPYLGVPGSWRTILLVLSGLAIAVVGLLLRTEALGRGGSPRRPQGGRASHSFVENTTPAERHEHKEDIISRV